MGLENAVVLREMVLLARARETLGRSRRSSVGCSFEVAGVGRPEEGIALREGRSIVLDGRRLFDFFDLIGSTLSHIRFHVVNDKRFTAMRTATEVASREDAARLPQTSSTSFIF